MGSSVRQVSTRVSKDAWRVIRFAMVLKEENSEQAFLRPFLEEFAQRLLADHPEIREMLRLAKEHEARMSGGIDDSVEDPGSSPKRPS
jgi:hypothetical protein